MPAIAPARFRVALVEALEALGKAPNDLSVERTHGGLVAFDWLWPAYVWRQSMQLTEADVIERGPEGIATLIAMSPKRRREALKLAEVA
jgi:hypothetical protein